MVERFKCVVTGQSEKGQAYCARPKGKIMEEAADSFTKLALHESRRDT